MGALNWLAERFRPSDELSAEELENGLKWWKRNGLGAQAMDTLTVGAFMTAFALELGASTILIGVLAAIPHLTQVGQIGGVYVIDRWRNRRAVSIICTAISRPMYLVMALAAFVSPASLALGLLVFAYSVRYVVTALMACGFNLWVRDLVPEGRRGRLTGARLAAMSAIAIVLGLGAGAFIDVWKANDFGPVAAAYSLLFVGAFIGGTYSTWCMTRMPEPRMAPPEEEIALIERLGHPWRDENYRRLLLFLGVWNFAVNLAAPFFLVHMLLRLHLDLWLVMALTLTSQLVNVMVLRRWGDIADRMSNKSVLRVCAPLFVACIFAWTFTTFPEPHAFTIPLLVVIHILTGISTAGVALASGNIALKLAPPGDATAYLANNSLVVSLASGVAPVIGGLVAAFFTQRELSLSLKWSDPEGSLAINTLSISQWDFFFVLAAVIGLFAVSMLRRVREVGEVEESLVLSEMYLQARRFVQNLSSIAGLRQAEEIPFGRFRTIDHDRKATDGTEDSRRSRP